MSTFKLHKTVIKQIDKYRKHCLWRGADINAKKPPSAAWETVCLPKKEGGLGVLNLRTQNEALLLKNLHKFFNRADIPWVNLIWESYYNNGSLTGIRKKGSFWWRDNLKLLDSYKGMAMVHIKDSASCYLWDDLWLNSVPKIQYPELFSFAKKPHITVRGAIDAFGPSALFHLPLSDAAYLQLTDLAGKLNSLQINSEADIWAYIWGSPFFSSAKAYIHLTGHRLVHAAFIWLWKSACQNKHKVFFWLLLKDRLSTRELPRRRNMELPDYNCVHCNTPTEETLEHLFLHCPFAHNCWASINLFVGNSNPFVTLEQFRDQLNVPFFMDVIIVMSWCIWMQRNDLIFRGILPSQAACLRHFKSEFALVIL